MPAALRTLRMILNTVFSSPLARFILAVEREPLAEGGIELRIAPGSPVRW